MFRPCKICPNDVAIRVRVRVPSVHLNECDTFNHSIFSNTKF